MTSDRKSGLLEELREKQERDEHALWQPGGFYATLKILVISGCQTLRLERHDMKILFFLFFSILLCGALHGDPQVCHIHDMACRLLCLFCD